MNPRTPVAITGLGPVSAIGNAVGPFWDALVAGRSGLRRISRWEPAEDACAVAAEVDAPPARPINWRNPKPRAVQLGVAAARKAYRDAALAELDPERVGVVVGTSLGNADLIAGILRRLQAGVEVPAAAAFRSFAHAGACEISRVLDTRGRLQTVTSGCNAGADALGLALDWLRLDYCDAVIAGGTEAEMTPEFIRLMEIARAVNTGYEDEPEAASRPFDRRRLGNVPGEGAAFLVLERAESATARGAPVRAYLAGFANRAAGRRPPYKARDPDEDTSTMLRTLRAALADAGIGPAAVSAMSANGSSSVAYDRIEAEAIVKLFAEVETPTSEIWTSTVAPPTYSVKAVLGQTGAVSPALQSIAAVLSTQHGIVPPTPNCEDQDPDCPVPLVRDAPLRGKVDYTLVHSIGFGGFYDTALVFASPDAIGRQ